MGEKPSWIPQDDWENLIAKPAREAERRRAEAALVRIAEHLDRQSPAASQGTEHPQLANVREAKDRAIEEHNFEAAAMFREIEKSLIHRK
jgi:hypothetical protein